MFRIISAGSGVILVETGRETIVSSRFSSDPGTGIIDLGKEMVDT
jgi:hypothetical protein